MSDIAVNLHDDLLLDDSGDIMLADDGLQLIQGIHLILSNSPGGIPTFLDQGAGLHVFRNAPNNPQTGALMEQQIARALVKLDPRLSNAVVKVFPTSFTSVGIAVVLPFARIGEQNPLEFFYQYQFNGAAP